MTRNIKALACVISLLVGGNYAIAACGDPISGLIPPPVYVEDQTFRARELCERFKDDVTLAASCAIIATQFAAEEAAREAARVAEAARRAANSQIVESAALVCQQEAINAAANGIQP